MPCGVETNCSARAPACFTAMQDPGQPYVYRIQGNDVEYELAPPVSRKAEKLEFIALADMGWGHKHKHPM
eukprot:354346-Chlamydomonas_euryale.AAC.23